MKKLICAILVLCIMLFSACAETYDLSKLSDNELLTLLTEVQQEVVTRRIAKTAKLKGGSYIGGEDLPAGKYIITVTYKGDMWANLTIYSERGNGSQKLWEVVTAEESPFQQVITVEKGDKLTCSEAFELTVYTGIVFD